MKSEVDLCRLVKAAELFPGFTLHEELGIDMFGNSCDMVYEKDDQVYCIEAKMQFNFEVVAQALRWKGKATSVYIAVPSVTLKNFWSNPKIEVAEALGIGIIGVWASPIAHADFAHPHYYPIFKDMPPYCSKRTLHIGLADSAFWRDIFASKLESKAPAGSQHGERSTPFTRSLCALKAEAANNPGLPLKELVKRVNHHWANDASAIHSLMQYAKRGIIDKFWV